MGSTSLTTFANGNVVSEMRYKAWGEVRYASGLSPTDYTYTGQFSYNIPEGGTADFGLMFYNARWYDSSLGRFAQADTIISDGVQGLDRYAYVNNNALRYTDPSGHKCVSEGPGDCTTTTAKGTKISINGSSSVANTGKPTGKGKKGKYGDGLIGPPKPPYNIFKTSFQMYPALPNSPSVESYTDYSKGGNPEYTPTIYNVPVNNSPTSVNQMSNGFELLDSAGMGILPFFYQNTQPYDQNVYINYTTTSINEIPVTNIIGINIGNSTYFNTAINYNLIVKVPYALKIESSGSAAPGQTIALPLADGVSSAGGFNVTVMANNTCTSTCIQSDPQISIWGSTNFVFNP